MPAPPDRRPPAPPYRGEGPHALWHYSEDPSIEVFRPRRVQVSDDDVEQVWTVDTRHAPLFWFPRDCPRATAWPGANTTDEDLERFFGHTDALRIQVVEHEWYEAIRSVRLFAYRLPGETFTPHEVGGYWVSQETVVPLERVEVGDVIGRHADAGIELRFTPSIWPWWTDVVRSSLDASGCRLRNCGQPMPVELAQQ